MPASEPASIAFLPSEPFVIIKFPRYNAWAVDQLKVIVPADSRAYDPDRKEWTMHIVWLPPVRRMLERAFGSVVEGSWDEPGGPEPIRKSDADFAALHLLPSAPPELVQAAYRALARLNHPDRGGSTTAMQRVNLAFEALQKRGAA